MATFTFIWRVADGSFYEQGFVASSLKAAKARWSHYTGLRQKDCTLFEVA